MHKFLVMSFGVYFMAALNLLNEPLTTATIKENKIQVATEFNLDSESEEDQIVATRTTHQEIPAGDLHRICAEIEDGIISVDGYDGDQVIINTKYKVYGRKEKTCEKLLDKICLETEVDEHDLLIKVKTKEKGKYEVKVFMELAVPNRLDVKLKSDKGLLEVRDLDGYVDLGIKNGDLTCEEVHGGIEFYTMNGIVYFKDVTGKINGVAANGGITCECNGVYPAELSFNTLNGITRLDFYGTPDAQLTAKTGNGGIHVKGVDGEVKESFFRKYEACLGDGRAKYNLNALNGSIRINIMNAE